MLLISLTIAKQKIVSVWYSKKQEKFTSDDNQRPQPRIETVNWLPQVKC